jgi:hypothetical protein
MARHAYRCHSCGKRRVGVTVLDGRDLCPECRSLTAPLRAVPRLEQANAQYEAALGERLAAILAAREAGLSWAKIAHELGLSVEGVRKIAARAS